jgi:hypothetical protein
MANNNNKTNSYLKCIQINLRHPISATLNLIKVMSDLDIDIALIQEPYAKNNIFNNNQIHLPYFPDTYNIHHSLNIDHAFGAAIVTKKAHLAETISSLSLLLYCCRVKFGHLNGCLMVFIKEAGDYII